ncbi:hypothetical protein B0H16DRAFT_1897443 [Mycena metata]|uniref:Uncharacterized protein n=1 Tax=Mycena metata TaxID=1033252 RepID=A0AAD7HER0_9AGAR|nr:hypothetical protein B0H16DRAFT_1897443 [Mycena metata]
MTPVGAACKTNKPGYYGKGSVEFSKPTNDIDGPTRRLAISADKLVTQPFAGIDTVYNVLQYVTKTHGTRDALGWRDIVDVHEEAKEVTKTVDGKKVKETKKWKYFQLSGYKYITYVQLKEQVDDIVRVLVDLGLATDDVFNIYAATSMDGNGIVASSYERTRELPHLSLFCVRVYCLSQLRISLVLWVYVEYGTRLLRCPSVCDYVHVHGY